METVDTAQQRGKRRHSGASWRKWDGLEKLVIAQQRGKRRHSGAS